MMVRVLVMLAVLAAASNGAPDGMGLTLESIVALLAAAQNATLLLEVAHGHWRERRCSVVLGGVMVNLVDRDGGVNNRWCDGFLLHNGLNSLVDVVVDMLALDSGVHRLGLPCGTLHTLVFELSGLLLQAGSDITLVTMLELAVLNGTQVVTVLFWKNLAILHWLDRVVVVILVNFFVDSGSNILVPCLVDSLVCDSRSNLLVDSGVMMSGLGHKVANGCLGFIHFDDLRFSLG